MALRKVPIVLCGFGKVGQGLLKSLCLNKSLFVRNAGVEFEVVAAFDSKAALFATGSSDQFVSQLFQIKGKGYSFSGVKTSCSLESAWKSIPPTCVVVDCSASAETAVPLLRHLQSEGRVVLANKKPLTDSMDVFDQFTHRAHRGRLRFESTCGAGTPFISCLQRLINCGDQYKSITGCFSGTLGFITTQMNQQTTMSGLLALAMEKGFTEPDPRDDLGGTDVARKALILARLVGQRLEMSDVSISPLYPASLATCSPLEFVQRYSSVDSEYAELIKSAASRQNVLRYVAEVNPQGVSVGLKPVPLASALGRLQGTDNFLQITSAIYKNPLIVQGAGAGVDVTVAGLIADLLELE